MFRAGNRHSGGQHGEHEGAHADFSLARYVTSNLRSSAKKLLPAPMVPHRGDRTSPHNPMRQFNFLASPSKS